MNIDKKDLEQFFDFILDKVEPCYKREVERVMDRIIEEHK